MLYKLKVKIMTESFFYQISSSFHCGNLKVFLSIIRSTFYFHLLCCKLVLKKSAESFAPQVVVAHMYLIFLVKETFENINKILLNHKQYTPELVIMCHFSNLKLFQWIKFINMAKLVALQNEPHKNC